LDTHGTRPSPPRSKTTVNTSCVTEAAALLFTPTLSLVPNIYKRSPGYPRARRDPKTLHHTDAGLPPRPRPPRGGLYHLSAPHGLEGLYPPAAPPRGGLYHLSAPHGRGGLYPGRAPPWRSLPSRGLRTRGLAPRPRPPVEVLPSRGFQARRLQLRPLTPTLLFNTKRHCLGHPRNQAKPAAI
jgi:hypothetical protein